MQRLRGAPQMGQGGTKRCQRVTTNAKENSTTGLEGGNKGTELYYNDSGELYKGVRGNNKRAEKYCKDSRKPYR